jgi:hypothetical protein
MTKSELHRLRVALYQLMSDEGDFMKGIEILAKLAEMKYPAAEVLKRMTLTDFRKLSSGPNQKFEVTK